MGASTSYHGSCHCGAVRFRVRVQEHTALRCNCSICTRKGFLHLIVGRDDFELLQGEIELVTYSFNTHVAKHRFCRTCGIHSFYTPRSHPDRIDVNIHCLDDVSPGQFRIEEFDGRHWEDNVDRIRSTG